MTVNLTPALPRLRSLVRMLGSENDGEALNAARAIGRTLAGLGGSFHDLADAIGQPGAPTVAAHRETQHESWEEIFKRWRAKPQIVPRFRDLSPAEREGWLTAGVESEVLDAWGKQFLGDVLTECREAVTITLSTRQLNKIDRLFYSLWEAGIRI